MNARLNMEIKIYDRKQARLDLMKGINRQLGICEQLRRIYDSVYELPESNLKEDITEKMIDALIMVKKMNDRLLYYHDLTHDMTGHLGKRLAVEKKPYVNDSETIKKRRMRKI